MASHVCAALLAPTPSSVVISPADIFIASVSLAEDIRAFVRTQLAAHEYPRHIEFMESLPMTATGKVLRRELRARG